LYQKFYSYPSIIKRLFTLDRLKGGVKSISVPIMTNLYFLKKIKIKVHPYEN
jgi:hypothetical protein